ncbi:MAG TPA: hypothetical protein VFH43_05585, partial [Candidatus Kapabacteria bacterium]|nr:hypothetical protein [Candidatus Kapabacteria bacterium]
MKRFLSLVALGLISVGANDAMAQRDLGARHILLTGDAGGTLEISYAGPGTATFVIPSGGGTLTPTGTTNNSTLRWNSATSTWVENTNVLASNGGGVNMTGAPLAATNTLLQVTAGAGGTNGTYYGVRSNITTGTGGIFDIVGVEGTAGGTDDWNIGGRFSASGPGPALGIDVTAGGMRVEGGINNTNDGITNAGAISGATTVAAVSETLAGENLVAGTLRLSPTAMSAADFTNIVFADGDIGTGPMELRYVDDGTPSIDVRGGTLSVGTANEFTVTSAGNVDATGLTLDNALAVAEGGTGVDASSTPINRVFASPAAGAPGAPTFRALVAADIPAGSSSYIQNQNAGPQVAANFNIDGNGTVGGTMSVGAGADILTIAEATITRATGGLNVNMGTSSTHFLGDNGATNTSFSTSDGVTATFRVGFPSANAAAIGSNEGQNLIIAGFENSNAYATEYARFGITGNLSTTRSATLGDGDDAINLNAGTGTFTLNSSTVDINAGAVSGVTSLTNTINNPLFGSTGIGPNGLKWEGTGVGYAGIISNTSGTNVANGLGINVSSNDPSTIALEVQTLGNAGALRVTGNAAVSAISLTTGGLVTSGAGTGILANGNLSGDVTTSGSLVTTIAANAIGSSEITDGSIMNADVNAAAAIDFSKLAALTSGNILVGNGSNVATSVAMSGDVTINNAGVTNIGSGVVGSTEIADGSVTYTDIQNVGIASLVGNPTGSPVPATDV